ncbi:hypothetical protein BC939DRAFT_469998 [Gamsiella multidivaricata]|uniref:uncharacterized protein n=1 Tax=Gamsiella multidivaricata TaxID=101098 RepID=UPI00221F38CF|nr:uncharacterized protein BC939DRAFT_469998 [Gamsiella multidivaricata]KAI7816180.1 hypothetical protein BC939DRAFT_469998 [Gamsiella multidivaricata]
MRLLNHSMESKGAIFSLSFFLLAISSLPSHTSTFPTPLSLSSPLPNPRLLSPLLPFLSPQSTLSSTRSLPTHSLVSSFHPHHPLFHCPIQDTQRLGAR